MLSTWRSFWMELFALTRDFMVRHTSVIMKARLFDQRKAVSESEKRQWKHRLGSVLKGSLVPLPLRLRHCVRIACFTSFTVRDCVCLAFPLPSKLPHKDSVFASRFHCRLSIPTKTVCLPRVFTAV